MPEEENRIVSSVCIKCQFQNGHDVDEDGFALIECNSCSTNYNVQAYQVRASGGRRDRNSGVKHYRIRVREPDRDERLFEFDSKHDIEVKSGDWIVGSFTKGKLKYLSNNTIRQYWDIQQGMGCVIVMVLLFTINLSTVATLVWGTIALS